VITFDNLQKFQEINSNGTRDFLAIRTKYLPSIPPEIMQNWELIQSFRKDIQLYREKTQP